MADIKNKKVALTGGVTAAEALRQIDPDVMAVYPITPQTPIIETYSKFQADGKVNTEIIQTESEHSAISACVGASAAGARTATATSSQGLALMNEILYIASGLRLPILMVVSARALSAPLNIHGDHSDVMGARDTGWIQIFSENAQEVYDNTIMGMKMAEKVKLPVMVIMDGFNTSHTVENLVIEGKSQIKKFLGPYKPKNYLLNINDPITFGFVSLQNSYFEYKIEQENAMQEARSVYQEVCKGFGKNFGRSYDFMEEYQLSDAEQAIVVAGSAAGTAKEVVDKLRAQGKKTGLLKIKLFRPFPHQEIAQAIKDIRQVAVLDRALSSGTYPPLYSEILHAINLLELHTQISPCVYGLGGKDLFQKDIEQIFEKLEDGKMNNKINYIGAS